LLNFFSFEGALLHLQKTKKYSTAAANMTALLHMSEMVRLAAKLDYEMVNNILGGNYY